MYETKPANWITIIIEGSIQYNYKLQLMQFTSQSKIEYHSTRGMKCAGFFGQEKQEYIVALKCPTTGKEFL